MTSGAAFEAEGTGPDLLLLHGFCETSQVWADWKKRLSDFRVVAPDLPGFGLAPPLPSPFTIDSVAEVLVEWIDRHRLKPLVVGHSLGGYVALAMAEKMPQRVRGVVLFHSTPYPDPDERKALRNKTLEFVRENGVAAFTRTLIPNLFHQKNLPAVAAVQRLAGQTPLQTVLDYTAAMRDRPDRSAFFLGYPGKKALIAGIQDALIPAEALRQLASLRPDIHLCELEGVGHMGMFENPAETARFVQDLA
jgi:pimeloyl-ACP methyl ester carboxylesterase